MELRAALPLLCLALGACTVVSPPGWETRAHEPEVVTYTRAHSSFVVPQSEQWPQGREIELEVRRHALSHGMGTYTAEIDFSVAYGDTLSEGLRCRHEPSGPGVPQARFGCWTDADASQALRFWIAPGLDCPTRNAGMMRTLTTPSCWEGELSLGERSIGLAHAYLKRAGSPVGQISWVSDEGTPLLAADITRSHRIELYDVNASLPDEFRQPLVLLSVALAWYEHASQPD